jgi:predicted peroxiredoxin
MLHKEVRAMAKFLFVLTRGLEDTSRSTRCLQLAKIANEAGHDVNVFLTDDGVVYAKNGMAENIVAATGDEMNPYLEALVQAKVPFYV